MFELIVGCVVVVLLLCGGGVYMADRTGWNRTVKRISKISRASIESKKGVRALEPRAGTQKALKAEWEAEFSGKPLVVKQTELNHVIVKHDFYMAMGGIDPWPRWTCKCGIGGHTASTFGMDHAIETTKQKGADHVRIFNKVEQEQLSPGFKF